MRIAARLLLAASLCSAICTALAEQPAAAASAEPASRVMGAPGARKVDSIDASRAERVSGYAQMSRDIQAMQDDPAVNPATFWLLDGQTLWDQPAGEKKASCSSCHGDAAQSMKGVAARYPLVREGRIVNLEAAINDCRTQRQGAPALGYESKPLLALTTYVASQSRGMPIVVEETPDNRERLTAGRARFDQRLGQLNLSCAQCHVENAGLKLGGSVIPQGHPTGYPLYRLEWQSVGSLARRLRNCVSGVRAEMWPAGSQELLELELYLAWRARGMTIETPAVRP